MSLWITTEAEDDRGTHAATTYLFPDVYRSTSAEDLKAIAAGVLAFEDQPAAVLPQA